MKILEKYKNKKVAVLYSGGLDSGLLAHHLLHMGAEQVALLMFDCGRENDPKSPFFDPTRPIDYVADIWQYNRYANLLEQANKTGKPYLQWPIRTSELQALSVLPQYLKPSEVALTQVEEEKGLVFYAGFVLIRFSQALAVASKYGFDYILTGHMDWNIHYADESLEFCSDTNKLFKKYYGSRLQVVPKIEMPFRNAQVTKTDLILANEASDFPLSYKNSISCNVSVLKYHNNEAIDFDLVDGKQVHCGKCLHCLDRKKAFEQAGVKDDAFFAVD